MIPRNTTLISYGSTALFVLLWSSGAIFSKWGLNHASVFAILALRFALAFSVLLTLGVFRRRWRPAPRTGVRVAFTGLLMIGCYSICYFLALDRGITPGVLATLLGVQPILTLILVERRFSATRMAGLALGLTGLILIVYQSIALSRFSISGIGFAFGALLGMTIGAILQKRVQQPPAEILPLQYGVSFLLCIAFLPFQPFAVEISVGLLIPLLWLALVISDVAQLLLYRLIRAGNLVNVTSLFYLVPAVTAAMDYVFLGNALSVQSLIGMGVILAGLGLVFRKPVRS